MRIPSTAALAFLLAFSSGCYRDHTVDGHRDGGAARDAGPVLDGAMITPTCTTVCDPPRLVARVPVTPGTPPAVLDAVVHRDELVVVLLQHADGDESGDRGVELALARVSRHTGEARVEVVAESATTSLAPYTADSIAAAALASRGETLTLVAARADAMTFDFQPEVLVATWEGATAAPDIARHPLTDEREHPCAGCFRRGAAVAIGEAGGIAWLPGEDELFVGRVDLTTGALTRETLSMPGVVPSTALEARADRSGVGLLTIGGTRALPSASGGPAFAMVASAHTLETPISIPGAPSDSVPHPWLHDGALEVVRFQRDEGFADGRLYRYAIEGSETVALGTLATAGDLPPLALASSASALLWIEASLAHVGESDLRVLAASPSCEEGERMPATVVHLPRPLGTGDPRALVATEHAGRTYAAVLEQDSGIGTAALVVFDLGACREGM